MSEPPARALKPWMDPYPQPLADAAFYGVLGEIVQEIAPHTEADPAGILASLIAGVGNLLGRQHWAEGGDKEHHLRFNVLLVGPTAARKGTGQAAADRILRLVAPVWAVQRRTAGLSSGEGLITPVRDETRSVEPVRGKNKEILRYQELITDAGVVDKRLLIVEEEFGRTLRAVNREQNTLSSVIRDAWDGNPLSTLTKNPARATDAHISIVGHITPTELRNLLRSLDIANGLANRFLLFAVRRMRYLPRGGSLDAAHAETLANLLQGHVAEARERPGLLAFDEEALGLWERVYPTLGAREEPLLAALTSRAEAQVLRLSLLYAVLDGARAMRRPHLRAALAVWRYCEETAACLFGTLADDPVLDTILVGLRQRPRTQTELSNLFNRHIPAEELAENLELLMDQGRVTFDAVRTRGRTKTIWRLVATDEEPPV